MTAALAAGLTVGPAGAGAADTGVLAPAIRDADSAKRPFRELTQIRARIGKERVRLVVADDDPERIQGLRERGDIGPYDGMLFAFPEQSSSSFTMSTVPVALDIGFYGPAGRRVDRLRMEPCAGAETDCPLYTPDGEFLYAVETLVGDLPRGRLRLAAE